MSYVYESNMALGLNGGVSSGFGPIRTSMTNSESKLRHFHPFNGYRLDCQRSFYERNEAANCLSRYGAGNNVASATVPESYLPGNGVYLANALYRHYLFPFNAGTLDTGYKHESSIRTLQNLCDPAAETGTSCRVSSSVDRKDQSHPFYCRKRVEPVEGMTRTRDKYRVVYTEKQRKGLENEYKTNKFITTERRAKLCEELNLSERQIKIWFQNRRAKERRDSKVEKGTEKTDSGNKSGDENNIDRMCSLNLAHADFSTSCRFAGNNVQLEERTVRHSQCRFMNQSTFCAINSNTSAALDALPFKSHDSGVMRHSVSPSDWSTSVANNLIPSLEVSPLTGNLNVEFEPRL